MIVYLARDIAAFVMYCVYGASRSSLLIGSNDSMIYIARNFLRVLIFTGTLPYALEVFLVVFILTLCAL